MLNSVSCCKHIFLFTQNNNYQLMYKMLLYDIHVPAGKGCSTRTVFLMAMNMQMFISFHWCTYKMCGCMRSSFPDMTLRLSSKPYPLLFPQYNRVGAVCEERNVIRACDRCCVVLLLVAHGSQEAADEIREETSRNSH